MKGETNMSKQATPTHTHVAQHRDGGHGPGRGADGRRRASGPRPRLPVLSPGCGAPLLHGERDREGEGPDCCIRASPTKASPSTRTRRRMRAPFRSTASTTSSTAATSIRRRSPRRRRSSPTIRCTRTRASRTTPRRAPPTARLRCTGSTTPSSARTSSRPIVAEANVRRGARGRGSPTKARCSTYASSGGTGANVAPTVTLAVSATSGNVGDFVTLTATPADTDGVVVKVEYFREGAKIGETTNAPHVYGVHARHRRHLQLQRDRHRQRRHDRSTSSPVTVDRDRWRQAAAAERVTSRRRSR